VQDQAIAITVELCQANKQRVSPEIQDVCNLLMQILEMALHLELCVLQICRIRPVLGRVEDFSKEVKSLFSGKTILHSCSTCACFHCPGYFFQYLSSEMLNIS